MEPQAQAGVSQHPLAMRLQVAPWTQEGDLKILAQDSQGRCFLLSDDHLCALHRDHGFASKPRACQQFPFFLLETPDGVQVGLSFRCSAVQQDHGVAWSEHEQVLRSLCQMGISRVGFEPVALGHATLAWAVYKGWEESWLLSLESGQGLSPAVARSLSPVLGFHPQAFEPLIQFLSASAVGFLESQDAEAAAEVTTALRLQRGYLSQRRGWVEARSQPFELSPDPQSARYLEHVLERKTLWTSQRFLGRLLMLLCAERMLSYYQASSSFDLAVDQIEGEWLTHRVGLETLELLFEQALSGLC